MPAAGIAPTLPHDAGEELDVSFSEDALAQLARLIATHGDTFRIYSPALQRDLYVLSHPDQVKHILVTNHANYTKGTGFERVRMLLGNGIIVSDGELWRGQRKMIQPAFHRNVIAQMTGHMRSANGKLLARWTAAADAGEPINLTQDASEVTLEIVLSALFGEGLDRLLKRGENPFAILTEESERNLTFAYRFRALSRLILDDIERRRRDDIRGPDIISILLEARDRKSGDPMPDKQVLDEIVTLIIAGHETTASVLNWTWYLLSQHPDVERQVHAEVDAIAAADPGVDELTQLSRLTYTRHVLEEAMRLYPPVWLFTRRSIEADTVGGYSIPRQTEVLISPYFIHRHPKFWPDAERFDPSRFDPARGEFNRYAYLPFGLGPRACIGEQFALFEMQMHVLMLARELRLAYDPREPIELEPQINLRTRYPLFMIPHRRSDR
jgi:cytochrome P450